MEAFIMGKIWQIYGDDAHQMTKRLLYESNAIKLVPRKASITLKPNLVVSDTADNGAVTHPGVLSGCIEYFQEHDVNDISIIESSWIGDESMHAMKTARYDRICKKYEIPFYDLKMDDTRCVKTDNGDINVCCRALDADFLVDLPVLKGHGQVKMTCAIKNLKGCIPDSEKRRFHRIGLTNPIALLASIIKVNLVIVDSICGDLNFEEGGTPVHTNRMYLGTDAVQIDAYGRSLMGLDKKDVPYIELSEKYGGGTAKWSKNDIINLNEAIESSNYPKQDGRIAKIAENVHENKACSACFASLIRSLYNIDYDDTSEIFIGQGWKEVELDGIGIGNCCSKATTCIMGCPPTAEEISEKLKRKTVN